MITDYTIMKNRLLNELDVRLKNNYIVNKSDIEQILNDMQDELTQPIKLNNDMLKQINSLSLDDLKHEIEACLNDTISGLCERDNLIILNAFANALKQHTTNLWNAEFEYCEYKCYVHEFEKPKFSICSYGTSVSLKDGLRHMAESKNSSNGTIFLTGLITEHYWKDSPSNRFYQDIFRYTAPKESIYARLRSIGLDERTIQEAYEESKTLHVNPRDGRPDTNVII